MQRRTSGRKALLAASTAGLLLLIGCSGTDGGGAAGEKVKLTMMYATSTNAESPFEALAEAYMEANDGVTIELKPQPNDTYGDTLRTQLQAGNAPDVIQTEAGSGQTRSILPLAEADFLEPLDPSVAELIPEGSEAMYSVDGTIYGQPLALSYIGLVYNETAASEAGVSEFPRDWDGVEAMCASLSEQGKSAFLLAGATVPNAGMTVMNLAATRVYAENPDWNQDRLDGKVSFSDSEGWKETLETFVKMNEANCFQKGAEGAGFDQLTNGIVSGEGLGFFVNLGAASELTTAAPDQTFVAQAFPPATEEDKEFGIAIATYSLSINAESDLKDEAAAFLAWVAEPEQASLFAEVSGGLPISGIEEMDFADTWYEPVEDLIKNGDYTDLPNAQWPNASVYETLGSGIQGLLTGQSTVESVLADLDAAWDK